MPVNGTRVVTQSKNPITALVRESAYSENSEPKINLRFKYILFLFSVLLSLLILPLLSATICIAFL